MMLSLNMWPMELDAVHMSDISLGSSGGMIGLSSPGFSSGASQSWPAGIYLAQATCRWLALL